MNIQFPFSPITEALGWTLVHSLWQIALIWLVFKLLATVFNQKSGVVYGLAMVAVGAAFIWAASTFYAHYHPISLVDSAPPALHLTVDVVEAVATVVVHETPPFVQAEQWIGDHAVLLGWCWVLGALILLMRLLGGWWLAQVLRTREVSAPGLIYEKMCLDWSKRLNIQQYVRLLESPYISEPLTLGFWKPVVLFPVGMLLKLGPAQAEALLLHELAHIRRHDYLVNMIQLVLEVVFFYHPLFWLISKEMRIRREHACDDLVVRLTRNPMVYAHALTDLQLTIIHQPNIFAMKAIGKSPFTERILRIAGITPQRSLRSNWVLLVALPLLFTLLTYRPEARAVEPETTQNVVKTPPAVQVPIEPSSPMKIPQPVVETAAAPVTADSVAPSVVAVVPEKMNVFYVGVDNPVTIAVPGYECSALTVQVAENMVGAEITQRSDCRYSVTVNAPGFVEILIFVKEKGELKQIGSSVFRVKRIPDPRPLMNGHKSSHISREELKKCKGVSAILENFDFDALCTIESYEFTYLAPGEDPSPEYAVYGAAFNAKVQELLNAAYEKGGQFFIDNIKVKCPGDPEVRNLGALSFKIE